MTLIPKPQHKRRVQKRGQKSKFTTKVRREIEERSGGCCERCGRSRAYCFEIAHLISAGQLGEGDVPWNGVLLCGPQVHRGKYQTCHAWVDSTAEGLEWRKKKRERLFKLYQSGIREWK